MLLLKENCAILFSTYDGNESEVSVWQDRGDAGEYAPSLITAVSDRTEFPAVRA